MRRWTFLIGLLGVAAGASEARANPGRALVAEMVAKVGGMDRLYRLGDVQYTYTYRLPDGREDVSSERYIFDGELSWARYSKRQAHALPQVHGELVQAYDGNRTWCAADGKRLTAPAALRSCDFLRKTNFYWFAMMQKLLDPGITYTYQGTRKVGGTDYRMVRITFNEGVGDSQDTYLLYINPRTKLVDRFLFTVMDFGKKQPNLMTVKYKTLSGVTLPVTRRYTQSDWNGTLPKDARWTTELMTDIKFGNGFSRDMTN
jgi:hypothetical protein